MAEVLQATGAATAGSDHWYREATRVRLRRWFMMHASILDRFPCWGITPKLCGVLVAFIDLVAGHCTTGSLQKGNLNACEL